MNNLSQIPQVVVERVVREVIEDDRVFISQMIDEASFMLASTGKPLVFKNTEAAEKYAKKNKLIDFEIDMFQDFDFTDIEIIEL